MITTANWKRGLSRVCMLAALVWVVGMGAYQYQDMQKADTDSVTIALSKDSELRIDASGIRQNDKKSMEMQRLAWVFVPALLLLLINPVGGWLAGGFKPEGQ